MAGDKIAMNSDADAITPMVGVRAKGTARADLGQTLISAIAKDAVFGASNLKAVYMKKKTGANYDYEAVEYDNIGAAITAGWTLAGSFKGKPRSFDITGAAVGLSRTLFCKVSSQVTIKWSQSNKVYAATPASARTFFGQTDAPANAKEVVSGANYFVFASDWNGFPKNTLLGRDALKARVRYAAATDADSGVYHSYCQETPTPPTP